VIVLVCLESPSPSTASRAALRLASTMGNKAEIVVLSAGGAPDSTSIELARQTSAVGRVIHLQDSALKDPDFLTLGMVLAEAARHLEARVVIAGEHSDGEGQGMVPAALAHHLQAPLFARVQAAALPATDDGVLLMTVRSGGRRCNVASPLPVVLTTPPAPEVGTPPSETKPFSTTVEALSLTQLGLDPSRLVPRPGLLGARVPAPAGLVQRRSFDEAARMLLRRR
jgi:electron transfer flavoprotein alpha/beta subunit